MPSETVTRYYLTGAIALQEITGRNGAVTAVDSFGYDQSGNRVQHVRRSGVNFTDTLYYGTAHSRLDSMKHTLATGFQLTHYVYNPDGSIKTDYVQDSYHPDPQYVRAYQYDALGRKSAGMPAPTPRRMPVVTIPMAGCSRTATGDLAWRSGSP